MRCIGRLGNPQRPTETDGKFGLLWGFFCVGSEYLLPYQAMLASTVLTHMASHKTFRASVGSSKLKVIKWVGNFSSTTVGNPRAELHPTHFSAELDEGWPGAPLVA
ncbi:hypothetical protein LCGC14_0850000 [marine sediment metagenome]|uniref:Uncharacterized protein n=1 Tax=marine sediment metagenome TaxID=412755 RepID=A0A0F9PAM6_9ZZZZ